MVGAVSFASSQIGAVTGLALTAAYLAIHGSYCLANFFRCREAHCIITGTGWSVLAAIAAGGALARHDVRGEVWNAFLAVTIAGFAFEAAWKTMRGTTALKLN